MPNVTYASGKVLIEKPVRYDELDPARSLTLAQVRDLDRFFRGRSNKKLNLETLRRWASPKRGFRPCGADGPTLVLPTLLAQGVHVTMPEWVDWFIQEANRLREKARERYEPPPSNRKLEREADAARKRMRKRGVNC
jgi:hypothetical protein